MNIHMNIQRKSCQRMLARLPILRTLPITMTVPPPGAVMSREEEGMSPLPQ
jgi:hypothetical protein